MVRSSRGGVTDRHPWRFRSTPTSGNRWRPALSRETFEVCETSKVWAWFSSWIRFRTRSFQISLVRHATLVILSGLTSQLAVLRSPAKNLRLCNEILVLKMAALESHRTCRWVQVLRGVATPKQSHPCGGDCFVGLRPSCLETLKARCFTGDLPQRTLSGRPVQHDICRSSLLGHMLPAAWGTAMTFHRPWRCPACGLW